MILPYIVNVALILGACLAFYKVLLRRETFYRINRYMLVGCLVVSFALPMLQVPQQFSLRKPAKETTVVVQQPLVVANDKQKPDTIPNKPVVQTPTSETTPSQSPETSGITIGNMMNWLFWLYWFGVAVFMVSFLFQVLLLLWRAYRNPVIIDGPYRIVEVSGDKAPCSFGNTIFINPSKYEWETYNQIIEHEKVHIRQKHTLDILIAELVLIFQWFNPFAWIYRREIENNLEFLTDDQLMEQKIDKKTYQLSLVKVSAPHFPLSLTTNYNQSILKKRIAMMNAKRSNLHTAWKYFFLVPLLAFLVCLLNEPAARSQSTNEKNVKNDANEEKRNRKHGMETEGYWFAVIKGDKVKFHFNDEKINDEKDEFSGHSFNSSTFNVSELGTIPKGSQGSFSITREAGRMEMNGKFEGNTGMGTYKYIADKAYTDYMNKELGEKLDDDEEIAFFFVNVRKDYVQMLKKEGFTRMDKDDVIAMAAMKIDAAYIKSIRDAGFKELDLEKLVPLKALDVDANYIKEIREAGFKDITTEQLVAFKAQKIDAAYINKVKQLKGKDGKEDIDDPDDIVSLKAMDIDEAFINSFKAAGLTNIPHDQLVAFKAVGVTADYIKGWQSLGFKDIDAEEFVGMKSQNVTPEFMKSFTDIGYKNIKPEELVSFKALGITPEYIRTFEAIGYKNIDADELPALKAQHITPDFIKSFEAVGFKNIPLEDIISVKAVGVTPDYIKDMKSKGFNYDKLHKYVTLKSID